MNFCGPKELAATKSLHSVVLLWPLLTLNKYNAAHISHSRCFSTPLPRVLSTTPPKPWWLSYDSVSMPVCILTNSHAGDNHRRPVQEAVANEAGGTAASHAVPVWFTVQGAGPSTDGGCCLLQCDASWLHPPLAGVRPPAHKQNLPCQH